MHYNRTDGSRTRGGTTSYFFFFFYSSFLSFSFFFSSMHHDALLQATIEKTMKDEISNSRLQSEENVKLSVPEHLRELRMMYA